MKQFHTPFSLIILTLLCSQTYIHTMEITTEINVPSLKDICLHYIGTHIDETNAIPNLSNMPVDLANDILLSTMPPLIGEHKDTLTALINKKELDHTILSSIAYKLCAFKTTLNKYMSARLSDIKCIITGFNNFTFDPAALAPFNAIVSSLSSKLTQSLKKELIVFNELAITIGANQSTIHKLSHLNNDSANKHVQRLLARNRESLEKLSVQASECIKQINVLQEYASTICIKTLIHDIAKKGTLSFDLAEKMCADFMNTDIPDSFDDLFNQYFPESILTNDNDRSLHIALTQPLNIDAIKSSTQFPMQEFEKQLPVTLKPTETSPWIEIAYTINKKYRRAIPCKFIKDEISENNTLAAFINTTHNILLVHSDDNDNDTTNDMNMIYITNMDSLTYLSFITNKIKQIGLNADCTQLGIIHNDDTVTTYDLPKELVSFVPSLKQRAFLSYLYEKMWDLMEGKYLPDLTRDVNYIVAAEFFKQHTNIPILTIYKFLSSLTKSNKYLIPESLYETIYSNRIKRLTGIAGSYTMFKLTSKKLSLTIEALCDKIISHEITTEFFIKTFNEIKLSLDETMSSMTAEQQREKMLAELVL